MKRGFTIVELMVVIVTIAILATIVTLGYIKYQEQADIGQTRSIANSVASAVQSYKNKNFEYPSAAMLSAQSTTGNPPTDNYAAASSVLGLPADALSSSYASFVPCSGSNCVLKADNKDKIYYLTKTAAIGTAETYSDGGGCFYTFKDTSLPYQDYIIAYYDTKTSWWMIEPSSSDVAITNHIYCQFRGI